MPLNRRENINKSYYSVAGAAIKLGVTPSTIRHWDKEFGDIHTKRYKNKRRFSQDDIKKLKEIKTLLREERYTIKGAKQKLSWFQ